MKLRMKHRVHIAIVSKSKQILLMGPLHITSSGIQHSIWRSFLPADQLYPKNDSVQLDWVAILCELWCTRTDTLYAFLFQQVAQTLTSDRVCN